MSPKLIAGLAVALIALGVLAASVGLWAVSAVDVMCAVVVAWCWQQARSLR